MKGVFSGWVFCGWSGGAGLHFLRCADGDHGNVCAFNVFSAGCWHHLFFATVIFGLVVAEIDCQLDTVHR